jgi:hypothetical protein
MWRMQILTTMMLEVFDVEYIDSWVIIEESELGHN